MNRKAILPLLLTLTMTACGTTAKTRTAVDETLKPEPSAPTQTIPDEKETINNSKASDKPTKNTETPIAQKKDLPRDADKNEDLQVTENIEEKIFALMAENKTEEAKQLYISLTSVSPEFEAEWIRKLVEDGHYVDARTIAMERFLKNSTNENEELYYFAFDSDPKFDYRVVNEIKVEDNNVIKALGGGSTVSLKYVVDDVNIAAIKPDQDLRQTMYRSEIAYFRLCEMLGCSFYVPQNSTIKISRRNFYALYNKISTQKQRAYSAKFPHIIWANENSESYMYATFKEWMTSFYAFPIELTSVWKPLLTAKSKKVPDIKSFTKSLYENEKSARRELASKALYFARDLQSEDLLRQISDIILVDFLVNNWDRFSGDPNNYGANCHIIEGSLMALDNGAAFPAWHTPRVVRRLHDVQQFSRPLVEKIRKLDIDKMVLRFFPQPTKEELKSIERFKERRQQALEYIDKLIAQHGEDKVLVFG